MHQCAAHLLSTELAVQCEGNTDDEATTRDNPKD